MEREENYNIEKRIEGKCKHCGGEYGIIVDTVSSTVCYEFSDCICSYENFADETETKDKEAAE